MNLLSRVKDVLLNPRSTWSVIAAEEADAATLYTRYLMIIAAIPAVAGFVATSLVGVSAFGASIRVPLATGLSQMVLSYALSLAMVYVLALIASTVAPGFGGQRNSLNALKLIVYGSTAAMVGGVFMLEPALAILSLAATLYSLYLLLLGVPLLMRVPDERALPYTAVLAACAIVLGAIGSIATGALQSGDPAWRSL